MDCLDEFDSLLTDGRRLQCAQELVCMGQLLAKTNGFDNRYWTAQKLATRIMEEQLVTPCHDPQVSLWQVAEVYTAVTVKEQVEKALTSQMQWLADHMPELIDAWCKQQGIESPIR